MRIEQANRRALATAANRGGRIMQLSEIKTIEQAKARHLTLSSVLEIEQNDLYNHKQESKSYKILSG